MSHKNASKYNNLIKHLTSSSSTTTTTSSNWRNNAKQSLLISQISSILLQRHNWPSLLSTTFNSPPSSPPPPPPPPPSFLNMTQQIFHQILNKIQTSPQISLNFFTWVKTHLGFNPNLKSHFKMIQILLGSGQIRPIEVQLLLDSFIGVDPPTHIVYTMVNAFNGTPIKLQSLAYSFVIESYALKGLYFDGLVVYNMIRRVNGSCLNKLLESLELYGEYKLGFCLFGSMFRNGILPDIETWSVVSRMCVKSGRFESVVRLLDMGVCSYEMFSLVIGCYCKVGNFVGAIDQVNEMCKRNIEAGFDTYGIVLDRACEFENWDVVEYVMSVMKEKKMVCEEMNLESYDGLIRKFCDLEMVYAAMFLFDRARNEKIVLNGGTFGCMLGALCKRGRVDDAIRLYFIITNERIILKNNCYLELVNRLCEEKPSQDVYQLLVDLIRRRFSPGVSNISKFVSKLVRTDQLPKVEDLLNVILQNGFVVDSCCCRSLVEYYCSLGRIESVIMLHDKLETLWDVTTYNILVRALFMEKRIDEAYSIFKGMSAKNVVNTATFLVVVSGLSEAGELRKAMQVHDEMLKRGLKPRSKTYKSLISVFRRCP